MSDSPDSARVDDSAIETAAAAWLAARDVGLTPEQAADFKRWRAADPRHEAAVAMLEQTREVLEQMPILRTDPALNRRMEQLGRLEPASSKVIRFPRMVAVASALAACLTIALALWMMRPDGSVFEAAYATAADGFQRVVLPDDSQIELHANTRVQVKFSRAQRQLTLADGEAHFTVAKDPARPFVVKAGNVGVRAIGTAFNVRLSPADVEVLVTEGRVHVGRTAMSTSRIRHADASSALVSAGERIVFSTDTGVAPHVTAMGSAAVRQTLTWRNPPLVFADTPLSEVVEKFNRHNRVRLEIGDAELNARTVGGRFLADQVESFVRLLEQSGDIVVHRPEPERIILRKVSPPPKP